MNKILLATLCAALVVASGCSRGGQTKNVDEKGPEKNTVTVIDQQAGMKVFVAHALLEKPGFVVIHRYAENGFGPAIGASDFLSAGTHTDIPINLTIETGAGQKLSAAIHADNGNSVYDPAADPAVFTADADPVYAVLTLTK